jgi:hypothetical protein
MGDNPSESVQWLDKHQTLIRCRNRLSVEGLKA